MFISEFVRLGEHNLSTEIDCADDDEEEFCAQPYQDIKVESFVAHPDFSSQTLLDDIGLVKLSQSAQLTQSTYNNDKFMVNFRCFFIEIVFCFCF